MTVKERETAEFSVELSHEKIPVVWYKNDVRLHPSKLVQMLDDGKVHKLAIKEVTLDDMSTIKVEAMGKTSEAILTVLGQCQRTKKGNQNFWFHILYILQIYFLSSQNTFRFFLSGFLSSLPVL